MTTQSRSTNSVQGDVQSASVATFMAINGNGFFAVQKPGTFTDGTPVFDGVDRYTRRGDFQIDKSGYLVNGAGYYLQGVPIDPTTGNPSGSSPQVLRFQNDFLPAQETTRIDYRANLASYPLTTKHDVSVPGSELIAAGSYSVGHNPLALGTPAAPYTDSTVSGTIQNNKATPSVANTLTTLLNGLAGPTRSPPTFSQATPSRSTPRPSPSWRQAPPATTRSTSTTISKPCWARSTRSRERALSSGYQRRLDHAAFRRTLQSLDPELNTAALAALGFNGTVTATRGGGGGVGTGQVVGNDNSTFLNESVAGGAVTTYDVSGAPVNLQFRWAKTDSTTLGAGHTDTWNLYYQVNPNATGNPGRLAERQHQFHLLGLGPDVAGSSVGHARQRRRQWRGARQPRHQLRHRRRHPVRRCQRQRPGQPDPAGRLPGRPVAVGRRRQPMAASSATIPTAATSTSPKSRSRPSTAPTSSNASTAARSRSRTDPDRRCIGKSGTIVGSSLEGSNTDIADEFTKLIVTQQAYSANTKVITTSNTMVQDLLNVLR